MVHTRQEAMGEEKMHREWKEKSFKNLSSLYVPVQQLLNCKGLAFYR